MIRSIKEWLDEYTCAHLWTMFDHEPDFKHKRLDAPGICEAFVAELGIPVKSCTALLVTPRGASPGTGWHRDGGDITGIVLLDTSPVWRAPLWIRAGNRGVWRVIDREARELVIVDNRMYEHMRGALTAEQAFRHRVLNIQVSV